MTDTAARPALQALRAGHGPALLLLHGIGSSAPSWQRQIDRLSDSYRLIAPDLRGYGNSPDPDGPASLAGAVEDLLPLLAGERGPVHVAGVSFGALLALALARSHPELVRSVVLADTTLGRAWMPPAERSVWRDGRYALAADLASCSTERAREIAAPGAPAGAIDEIAANMRRARPAGYRAVTDILVATDARPWLGEVRVPALVLCGEHDGVVGTSLSRDLATALPDARFASIPGAGHAPHIEQPDVVAQAIRAFLESVDAPDDVVRVAIAGTGAIAGVLADGIARGDAGHARVVAVGCRPGATATSRPIALRQSAALIDDLAQLADGADVVIEAASAGVVREFAAGWLARGADVMVLSAGALVDAAFTATLRGAARAAKRHVLVPSGAIAGIDGIRAGALGGLRRVELRTTKPPRGLAGAPYVVERGLDLDALTATTTIFEGSVADAVRGFPSNVNVASILSLAATGATLHVSVIADPHATVNTHEIRAEGDFGRCTFRLENEPCAANPKTSALAPLSALAMLRRRSEPLWVGA
jgi:aspartate dehydrogenase